VPLPRAAHRVRRASRAPRIACAAHRVRRASRAPRIACAAHRVRVCAAPPHRLIAHFTLPAALALVMAVSSLEADS
jgi:hypothetical protein